MKKTIILLLSFFLTVNVVSGKTALKKVSCQKRVMLAIGMLSGAVALSYPLGTLTNEFGIISPPQEYPSTIPNVRVFKIFNPSHEIVQGLLVHLEQFDTWMTGLGFETPPKTRFFIPVIQNTPLHD